ncbi:hypothetical protein C7S18_18455 [Ahniella affigens]|uniref:EamA domain-containing protein n=1 Tax=Ahniella affigens TaxID=2021234 RepID=A0A2P1PW13_9GAMM|nr:DMT family transporter [Ahniella affigens]AVP99036.1 hypothetical protein C7S18_18455 [Ahniella affigens]
MAERLIGMGLGEMCSLTAAATWAVGVVIYRKLGARIPPMRLNLLKNLLVLAAILPLAWVFAGAEGLHLSYPEWGLVLTSGFLGIGVADTLYFYALNELGAARMGIVGNLYSPFVILLSYLFLSERLGIAQLVGFALVAGGVLMISTGTSFAGQSSARFKPLLLGVLSIALMAGSVVMVKRVLETHSLWWVSAVRVGAGALGLFLVLTLLRDPKAAERTPMSARDWRLLALGALIGQLLSMVFWLAGYKYTTASVAAILNETASAFIVLFAWLALGEQINRRKIIGLALTLTGVSLMLALGRG